MTFFDKLPFIGKEIIVQTLDTFSYALSRRWTISEISHPVTIDVTSDLMNHMSEPLLSAYGAQNTVIIVFFAFLSAQWLKSRAKSRKLHSCVLVIVHRERPGALTAERQASGARRLAASRWRRRFCETSSMDLILFNWPPNF